MGTSTDNLKPQSLNYVTRTLHFLKTSAYTYLILCLTCCTCHTSNSLSPPLSTATIDIFLIGFYRNSISCILNETFFSDLCIYKLKSIYWYVLITYTNLLAPNRWNFSDDVNDDDNNISLWQHGAITGFLRSPSLTYHVCLTSYAGPNPIINAWLLH